MRCDSEAERYLPFTWVILHPWRTSEVRYAAVGAFARRGGKVRSLEALSLWIEAAMDATSSGE
jgi:hypothetical protein